MKRTKQTLLLHPVFLISLAVLLLNDFFWKDAYSNWLTGKLSDAAGMVVLPVVLGQLFPKLNKWWVVVASGLFFIWWKSAASQTVIDVLNDLSLPVQRVIDAGDYMVLPLLGLFFFLRPVAVQAHRRLQRPMHYGVAAVALFSLCSTSVAYRQMYMHLPNEVELHEEFTFAGTEEQLLQSLQARNIVFRRDSIIYRPLVGSVGDDVFFSEREPTDSTTYRRLPTDSVVYLRTKLHPFYLVKSYTASGEQLKDIRFRLSSNKKRTKCFVYVSSLVSSKADFYWSDKAVQKAYKEALRELFGAKK